MQLRSVRHPEKGTALALKARFELDQLVVEMIWEDLAQYCDILQDGSQGYLFLKEERRVVTIGTGLEFADLLTRYQLLPGDPLTRKVRETIGIWAIHRGKSVTIRSISHYDESSHTLYIRLRPGRLCRISAATIEEVDNGTDGVLFRDAGQEPFHVDLQDLPNLQYGLKISDESQLCQVLDANWLDDATAQRQLYFCSVMALLFQGMFGAKCIVLNTGEHRSGKTTAALKIGWILVGNQFCATLLNRDRKDVETALTNEFLVVLDNVDSNESLTGAIEDLMAVAATGGSISRRRLYSDNTLVNTPLMSQVYVTSRGVPFVRNDVVDRTLIFRFGKFDEPDAPQARGEKEVRQSVLSQRDQLMAELIVRCQKILAALETKSNRRYNSSFRIKDFSQFCLASADAEGWLPEMEAIFQSVMEEQKRTSINGNPLFHLLRLAIGRNATALANKCSATMLLREINKAAAAAHMSNPAATVQKLGKLLSEAKTDLGFELGMKVSWDGKNKAWSYSFNPSTDVRDHCTAEARKLTMTERP